MLSHLNKNQRTMNPSTLCLMFILVVVLIFCPTEQILAACSDFCPPVAFTPSAVISNIKPAPGDADSVTFTITYAGQAYDESSSGLTNIKLILFTQNGNIDQSFFAANGSSGCVSGSKTICKTYVLIPGFQMSFFTVARPNGGVSTCRWDTSNTTLVTVPGSPQPDTLLAARPTPEELGPEICEAQFGDPISTSSGNVYQRQVDVAIPTDVGIPIEFARSYNSGSLRNGSLGHKWTHSYDCFLTVESDSDVVLTEGSGREFTFTHNRQSDTGFVHYFAPHGIHYKIDHDTVTDIYTVTYPNDDKYVFDTNYDLDYIEDRNGNQTDLTYTSGKLTSVTDESDRGIDLNYNLDTLTSITESAAGSTLVTYTYTDQDELLRSTYADAGYAEFTYDTSGYHQLEKMTTSDGVSHHWRYDENDHGIEYSMNDDVERVGADFYFIRKTSCLSPPFETELDLDVGGTSTHTSDWNPDGTRRQLMTVTNPTCGGCATEYGYDGAGNRNWVAYADGKEDSFEYDHRGNMTKQTIGSNTPIPQVTRWSYDDVYNLPTLQRSASIVNSSDSSSTIYIRDANGNLDTLIETGWYKTDSSYADTTVYRYNANGQIEWIDGPRTNIVDTTGFTYYNNGDLKKVFTANSNVTEYGQRDSLGRRPWLIEPNEMKTYFYYSERGRVDSSLIVNPDSTYRHRRVDFTYDFDGNITSTSVYIGHELRYNYDDHNWLTSIANSVGDSIAYTYDSLSNRTSEKIYNSGDTLYKEEYYRYNVHSLLEKVWFSATDTLTSINITYDNMDRRELVLDENGNYTYYAYDTLGRISQVARMDGSDSIITLFEYDSHNNVRKVTDPDGYEFVYQYDDLSQLLYDSSGVTGITTYRYDEAGNLKEKVNSASVTVDYSYDNMNRLTLIDYPGTTEDITYTYDNDTLWQFGLGRLYMESGPSDTTKYHYNDFGQIEKEIRSIGGSSYATSYTYGPGGNLLRMDYPNGEFFIYSKDSMLRTDWVLFGKDHKSDTLIHSIKYAPFGGAIDWVLGNDIPTHVGYNKRYFVESIKTDTFNVIDRTYSFADNGTITGFEDILDTMNSFAFAYDNLNRLSFAKSLSMTNDSILYQYSDNGNRDTMINGADTLAYYYNQNRLDSINGPDITLFLYDSLGNIIYDSSDAGVRTYQYDYENRLTSVNNDTTASYEYDARSLRMRTSAGATGRVHIFDNDGRVISEFTSSGAWRESYIYLDGKPLAKLTPPNLPGPRGGSSTMGIGEPPSSEPSEFVFYYHNDHLGTPLAMTDKNAIVKYSATYYPFGGLLSENVVHSNELRFPGQYHDRETDLHYNWHRHYDPDLGRYLQSDPIGLVGGMNLYGYANQNSLSFTDPMGLEYYSATWTEKKLAEIGKQNLAQAMWNHRGRGEYDFYYHNQNDTFNVCGQEYTAGQFGNYAAGYAFQKAGGFFGYGMARQGGVVFDFSGATENWLGVRLFGRPSTDAVWDWDADSVPEINAGALRAWLEELRRQSKKCKNQCK